ncbi:DUF1934 family protein [Neobacillus sp. PS3-34]|uniref:DUF1934 domain-containing protein n=1 Tax=Neobacillus sp. PS3-34 TaxID=3070678 RepID=UPI0027DF11BC|nr:DUF1934 family protein [Neobacillus sp. PS3-34]WML50470.1 DUF1934 family protein [Neobacillus sp. PS3-34]
MSVPSVMPVKVQVKTSVFNGKTKETYQLAADGRYYNKGDAYFLQYEEVLEEDRIRTIVKVDGDSALILRSGSIKMRMPFLLNKKQRGSYETPAGMLETEATAKRIAHTYSQGVHSGSVEILYDLKVQGSRAGTYHLEIIFEEDMQ